MGEKGKFRWFLGFTNSHRSTLNLNIDLLHCRAIKFYLTTFK